MGNVLAKTIALSLFLSGPLAAQSTLVVLNTEGQPIPAVRVDVFGTAELLGTFPTSARGVAELDLDRWSEARRVTLSHVGFETRVVQTDELPEDGVLFMEPRAIEIEGLTVEGADLCPIVDDPRARQLWSEIASRYAEDTGTRAWSAYLSLSRSRVQEGELRQASNSEAVDYVAAGHPLVIHGGDHTSRSLDDRIANEGYAWEPLVVAGTTRSRESAWGYPEFDRAHAYHFASPVFAAGHDFAVDSDSDEQTTLIFCGHKEGDAATIEGVIRLTPGEGFLSAEWRFRTPEPDEGAGGMVSFRSYVEARGQKPHLVSSRKLFFRRSAASGPYADLGPSYMAHGTGGVGWYLHPSDIHPCNEGLSFFPVPPTTRDGVRFAECIARNWGRE